MIAKQYRLTERELGKVLSKRKPFFSYMFVANALPNTLWHGRCAILLSSKVARGSVNRNFWRRRFYDISLPYLETWESKILNRSWPLPLWGGVGGDTPPNLPYEGRNGVANPRAFDIVFVPKKGTILNHKDEKQLEEFKKNIQFIYRKIRENTTEKEHTKESSKAPKI